MSSFSSRQTACAIPVVGNWGPSSSHTNISSSTYNNHSKSILLEAPKRNTETHTHGPKRMASTIIIICSSASRWSNSRSSCSTSQNQIAFCNSVQSELSTWHCLHVIVQETRDTLHRSNSCYISCAHHPLCAVSLTRGCRVHYRVVAVVALTITVRWGAFLCRK